MSLCTPHNLLCVPRAAAKKQRVTYEAAASVARSRPPSGNQPGAVQSAPKWPARLDTRATSLEVDTSVGASSPGAPAPRDSGGSHCGRAAPVAAALDPSRESRGTPELPTPVPSAPASNLEWVRGEIHSLGSVSTLWRWLSALGLAERLP